MTQQDASNRTTVDSGALKLALNVLRRAGKNEVADALEEAAIRGQSALAEQPALATCKSCNGNDGDAPCAYPSEGKHGCLRDARLSLAEQDDEAVAYWLYEITLGQGVYQGCTGDDAETVISEVASSFESSGKPFKTYTRPAPKTYTEHDIDEAIGSVDWANTSWQQAAVEAKKLVMRFVGSVVQNGGNSELCEKLLYLSERLEDLNFTTCRLQDAAIIRGLVNQYSKSSCKRVPKRLSDEEITAALIHADLPPIMLNDIVLDKLRDFANALMDKMTGGGK